MVINAIDRVDRSVSGHATGSRKAMFSRFMSFSGCNPVMVVAEHNSLFSQLAEHCQFFLSRTAGLFLRGSGVTIQ
jgi:hypothetical protein